MPACAPACLQMACSCSLLRSPAVHLQAAGGRRRRQGTTGGFAVVWSSHAPPPTRRRGGGGELCPVDASLGDGVGQLKRRHTVGYLLEKVRTSRILQVDDPVKAMATVEKLQRLGIDYHFEEEVGTLLHLLYDSFDSGGGGSTGSSAGGLHDVSLSFRLLRHHGFHVPTDIFECCRFTDRHGSFKQSLSKDIPGLLGLYEASHLGVGDEHVLDEAQAFSHKHLKASMGSLAPNLAQQVKHALDHPYHTTLQRYNSRRYLEHFERKSGGDALLGELARLDFNVVQALHRSELDNFSRWWKDSGLSQDLMFARNQPSKWYMGALAVLADTKFSDYRIEITKCVALIYIIDDIFDVYASFDELVLFTEAVKKWDPLEVETLPSYMKMCYTTLYNVTNEIACKVCKEHGWNPISSLKKSWVMLFDAFLVEARWFASGHIPTSDDYLRNGVISSGLHVVLIHTFFLLGQNLTMDNITYLEEIPPLISIPATMLRLWDDLGTAKDENQSGFDGSYIQSLVRELDDCSTTSAKKHVMDMISTSWKGLNKAVLSSGSFSSAFLAASLNSARMVTTIYSYEHNQRVLTLENFVDLLLLEYA